MTSSHQLLRRLTSPSSSSIYRHHSTLLSPLGNAISVTTTTTSLRNGQICACEVPMMAPQHRHFHCNFNVNYQQQQQEAKAQDSSNNDSTDELENIPKARIPPRTQISRSPHHEMLLSQAHEKRNQLEMRDAYLKNNIVPLRELYFNAASQFEHSPKSPARKATGVLPDYTTYFPAAVKKYDKTGMALTEHQVHKKFKAWWMRTTGRGPPEKGAEKTKKRKKRK